MARQLLTGSAMKLIHETLRSYSIVLLLTAGAAACGTDPPPIDGYYLTTSHTTNTSGCGTGTADDSSPLFQIVKHGSYYTLNECTTTDRSSCVDMGIQVTFAFGQDHGWTGYVAGSSPGTTCTLYYQHNEATLSGSTLTVEVDDYRLDSTSLPTSSCTTDQAKQMGTSMPCISSEILVGTKQP